MRRCLKYLLILVFFISFGDYLTAQELIIQENETGFCAVDGTIQTSVSGYTGDGYADTDRGVGKSISWAVNAEQAGTYGITWRYGNGGGSGDRPATLLLNGVVALARVNFPHTGTWTNWTESDTTFVELATGNTTIRIEAHSEDGLGNYDYVTFIGEGLSAAECIPSYILMVGQNDAAGGSVSYEPVQNYYAEGTEVTLTAQANPGYFFQSWSGDATSAEAVYTFEIRKNVEATAIFLPDGTTMDENITGYATVQDDAGTPYLVIGGALGDTVHAQSMRDLQDYLSRPEPYVVTLSDKMVGTQTISVTSNKTLLGIGDTAHLQGIELSINRARNVIVQNIKVSHVTPQDAIEINGKSQNIWIDHCELFSDRDHGSDYYDGLLDIKNESSFITISWTIFHDHSKTSLISSGDQAVADSVIRVTYHHNFFYNCNSRLPSIRFGKAHIFNNYYKNCGTAINSRMGACVRVERNYFTGVGTAVMMAYSLVVGSVQLIDNHFGNSGVSTSPTCVLDVPYAYEGFLDETEDLPEIITQEIGTSVAEENPVIPAEFTLSNYPNPFNASTKIHFSIVKKSQVSINIFNTQGQEVVVPAKGEEYLPGDHTLNWNAAGLASGVYFMILQTDEFSLKRKMLLLR